MKCEQYCAENIPAGNYIQKKLWVCVCVVCYNPVITDCTGVVRRTLYQVNISVKFVKIKVV